MGSMKNFSPKTALHIAVFLSLFTAGCYTTIRSAAKIEQSEPQSYGTPAWDFGYAWYADGLNSNSAHYYYHYVPWWYNNRPAVRDSSSIQETIPDSTGGKIVRRDFNDPIGGNFSPAISPQPITPNTTDSLTRSAANSDTTAKTINNQTNNSEDKNKQNNIDKSSGKVNRRGRR